MHDFCFTIPYGLALVIGGVIGYLKKGSVASLGGGAGIGLVLIIAGYLSLKAFEKRKNSFLGLAIETGKTLLFLPYGCSFWSGSVHVPDCVCTLTCYVFEMMLILIIYE